MLHGYRNIHSVNRISRENLTIWFLFTPLSQPFKLRVAWRVLFGGEGRGVVVVLSRVIRRGCKGRFVGGGSLFLLVLQVKIVGSVM